MKAALLVSSSIFVKAGLTGETSIPNTFPDLTACVSEPSFFSCENTTTIKNTCCSPTPGGLVLQTQFWDTFTGLEKKGQKLPKGSWTIHGLWPDNCDSSFDSYCDLSRQFDREPSPATLPDGTPVPSYTGPGVDTFIKNFGRQDLLDYMNKYWISQGSTNADFWAHEVLVQAYLSVIKHLLMVKSEFSKHATCTSTFDVACYGSKYKKNQDVIDFFDAVVRAFHQYPTFDMLAAAGILPSNRTSYKLTQLQNAIKTQTGSVPFFGCTNNGTVLSEVWYFSHVFGTVRPMYDGPSSSLSSVAKMTVTLDLDSAKSDSHTRRTLTDISLAVAKGKKIVVVTGAGISCSCGIPDFRSSDGLYALVKEQYPDVVLKGRDLFDASLFRDATSTAVFYTFISQLKRSIDAAEPAPTHHFIKTLDSKKKLLRSYTQNIDGLEARVGLLGSSCQDAKSSGKGKTKIRTKDVRNVQLHEEHLVIFEKGNAPDCPECLSRSEARAARAARPIRVGNLRPGIVLYDETHPLGDDIGIIHTSDLGRKPDMLIIMGTSLKVHGLKKLVKDFARSIHSSTSPSDASSSKKPFKVIFVNKTAPGAEWNDIIDYHISGETDRWTNKVIEDWKRMKPADWEVQQTLIDNASETSMNNGLKVGKSLTAKGKGGKAASGRENIPILPSDLTEKLVPHIDNAKPVPPLSPSKRQQKSCHYDDVESSPSKRQSTSVNRNAMPKEERKMLFAETTNKPSISITDARGQSKMDISLCDLSMHDLESKLAVRSRKSSTKGSRHKVIADTSQMDISFNAHDISMISMQGEDPVAPMTSPPKASKAKRLVKQHTVTSRPVRQSVDATTGKRVVRKRRQVA
ncbi:hypothetical protein CVT25_005771 [Psilocybe cyanescens]|uniref:Deacetylase sirtuin-type domain-containing protein n=1 Tax=Psilocybe cyanescens TaxID=93625 RepID=A0A409VLN6_PSICY|nr:hypothetical protein CVT25_005771 [Psilocybe cyanescens]